MSIKNRVKKIVYGNARLEKCYSNFMRKRHMGGCLVNNQGYGRYSCDVIGENNQIIIGKDTFLKDTIFRIRGNENQIIIDDDCTIGAKCSFWIEGTNSIIHIGRQSTFTHTVHFCAQEDNISINVGMDCMFSNNIVVRTSDSHPIYRIDDNQRINPAKSVTIGNHVWVAPNTKIMKGVNIENGSIIGSDTIVTKVIPENSLAVGHPARVVKSNIKWTREILF